ncbi:MAG TPA: serine/threonine-protein kinase [Nannocystaceae bacterium]|nr:serine/threonine-protein kinase [Nannocystaceae bacterium]
MGADFERTTVPAHQDADTVVVGAEAGAGMPEPGVQLGRYRLIELLGKGGMGSVFAAHDPELGRRIALKVLRTPASSARAKHELLREAQALALLSHPNVVPIYDVGSAGELVWIAMAELRGPSLMQWLSAEPRTWQQIVAIFVEAAAGLAAAHRDRLVHGDFKPANVIVEESRAKVVDFGLARRVGVEGPHALESHDALPRHDEATTDGVVHGTPAYMAPEQLRGQPLDPRTDQFAFCVALFQALHGRHPFLEDAELEERPKVKQMLARVDRGQVAPTSDAVPHAIDRVLARGLAPRPGLRWPSMDALSAKLEAVLRPRQRWPTALLVAVLGGATAIAWMRPDGTKTCPDDPLAEVWSDARATTVVARLERFDAPYAPDTAARVGSGLAEYTARWRDTFAQICAAPDEDFDRRMRCMTDRRVALATTLDVLEHPDASTLVRAVSAVESLADPHACIEPLAAIAAVQSPGIVALEDHITEIDALDNAGRYDAALVAARATVAEADAQGDAKLQGEAYHRLGAAFDRLGRYGEAEPALERAVHFAQAAGDDDTAVGAMADLVKVVGHDLLRLEDGRAWERHAEATLPRFEGRPALVAALRNSEGLLRLAAGEPDAAIERFGDALAITDASGADPLRMASALNNYANALAAAGRYGEARSALERAIGLLEETLGPNHPAIAGDLSNLGFIADRQGDLAAARKYLERGVAIAAAGAGEDHPGLHEATNNLAVFYYSAGELESAAQLFDRTRMLAEKNLGRDHPGLAKVIGNQALCAKELGDLDRAMELYAQALTLQERALGPEHIDLALTLNNRGSALRELGRFAEARASYEQALSIREAKLGKDHPDLATTIDNLGLLARAEGNPSAAIPMHERALAIWTKAHGERHEKVGRALTHLALAHAELGERTQAKALLERAHAIYESIPLTDPTAIADNQLALATELADDDRDRARLLARAALAAFEDAGRGYADETEQTRALLLRIGG